MRDGLLTFTALGYGGLLKFAYLCGQQSRLEECQKKDRDSPEGMEMSIWRSKVKESQEMNGIEKHVRVSPPLNQVGCLGFILVFVLFCLFMLLTSFKFGLDWSQERFHPVFIRITIVCVVVELVYIWCFDWLTGFFSKWMAYRFVHETDPDKAHFFWKYYVRDRDTLDNYSFVYEDETCHKPLPKRLFNKSNKRLYKLWFGAHVVMGAFLLFVFWDSNETEADVYDDENAVMLKVGDVPYIDTVCYEMVMVPAGLFVMGNTEEQHLSGNYAKWASPSHLVMLDTFWIGRTEVGGDLWNVIMPDKRSTQATDWFSREQPVNYVSWEDCMLFMKRLNERFPHARLEYRLPTEAEWEYAARGGLS